MSSTNARKPAKLALCAVARKLLTALGRDHDQEGLYLSQPQWVNVQLPAQTGQ